MMKKFGKMLLSGMFVGALFLTGCSGNDSASGAKNDSSAGGKEKVTFWAAAVSEDRQEFFDWFADHVSEEYPDIELDMLGVHGSLNDYRQKLDVAIQAAVGIHH